MMSPFKDEEFNDPEGILEDEDFVIGINPFNHPGNEYDVNKAFDMELKPSITEELRNYEVNNEKDQHESLGSCCGQQDEEKPHVHVLKRKPIGKNYYEKNICRYLTRMTIKCMISREYKQKVLELCANNTEVYKNLLNNFLIKIEYK